MSNTSTSSAPASDAWAEVRARDRVTRYRRSGAGRAVLLLDRNHGAGLWPELLHVLGANFRVIAPEVPVGAANVESWIAEFLEGLGTAAIAVVATCDYCVPAVDLVLRDCDQVERVVLLPEGDADDQGREGSLATSAGPSAVPLLIVRRGVSADEAVPTITRFLSGTTTKA